MANFLDAVICMAIFFDGCNLVGSMLYLDLALVDLSGVGGGLPRATPAEVVQVKSRSWT